MIIQNFERSYQVIRYLGGTEKTEEFLCKEIQDQDDNFCMLVRSTDLVFSKNFTLFLEEKIRGSEFTDYKECFQFDGDFYAVFSYSNEQTLDERLNGEFSNLRERAQIVKNLFEKILILNPHPFFAWNALLPENITVSRSLDVHWKYHLENIEQADEFSLENVRLRMRSVIQYVFVKELEKKLYPQLNEYVAYLGTSDAQTYMDLYQSFMPLYEELTREREDEPTPKTFWFRLWERMRKIIAVGKKVLMVAILVAAVWYVIYTLRDDSGTQVTSAAIKQIGDLIIK